MGSSDLILTVRQPWADLVMSGLKDVENRSWPVPSTLPQHRRALPDYSMWGDVGQRRSDPTPFPFRLGIHAAKTIDHQPADIVPDGEWWLGLPYYPTDVVDVALGVLLGFVTVTGCHHARECLHETSNDVTQWSQFDFCSKWAEPGQYHWTLADPEPLEVPIPMKGKQRLWRLPDDVLAPQRAFTN